MRMMIIASLGLLVAACHESPHYYPSSSVTVTSIREANDALDVGFAVRERGKIYDCPEVKVVPANDRIDLLFVQRKADDVKMPSHAVRIANPNHLPVYISGVSANDGPPPKKIWPPEPR